MVPMIGLTFILILMSGIIIVDNYINLHQLQKLKKNILLSSKISLVLDNIQKERGLSCGYIVSEKKKFQKELFKQRINSDYSIDDLKNYITNTISKESYKHTEKNCN